MDEITLWQGDCLERMAEIADGSVSAVVTDPPYGIDYKHGNTASSGRSGITVEWDSIEGDNEVDSRWLGEAYRVLMDGGALYLCTRWDVEPQWRIDCESYGFLVKQRLTWHKRARGKGDLVGTYAPTTEDVLFVTKGRHKLRSRPASLLDVGCVPTWEHRYHPHQKPVALPKLLIEASTDRGDVVLDPFCGSGTTLVACQKSGRRAIGIELNSNYIAVCEKRIKDNSTPLFAGLEIGVDDGRQSDSC